LAGQIGLFREWFGSMADCGVIGPTEIFDYSHGSHAPAAQE